MPTPSTRRRFLTGAAGLAAVLAGCNDGSGPSQRGTVTPVDVPRTDEELLAEAAAIESPSVSSSVTVSEAHYDSAIDHVESVRQAAATALDDSDIDPSNPDAVPYGTPESILEETDSRLEDARRAGPSRAAIRAASRALREVSRLLGVLRAENGTTDRESVLRELRTEREAVDALGDEFEYRIASPLGEHLPTLAAAEEALREAEENRSFTDQFEGDDDSIRPHEFGEIRLRIERLRRQRDDVEAFRSTATDEGAPSVRGEVDAALSELATEVRSVAEEYGAEAPEPPEEAGRTVEGRVRNVRRSVGARSRQWTEEVDEYRRDGQRVVGLLDLIEWLLLFEAVDAAVDRTLSRLDPEKFPTESVVSEKRRAVDALEPVADGTALQCRFAERAHGLLRNADGRAERGIENTEEIAFVHLLYASAAECANGASTRSEWLTGTLRE